MSVRLRLGAAVFGHLSRAKDNNSSFLDLIKANTKIPDGLEAPTREMCVWIGKMFYGIQADNLNSHKVANHPVS
jgi:hypothetical protein